MKKAKQNSKTWLSIAGAVVGLAILLWFPVIQPQLRKSKAQHDVNELAIALNAYVVTYGVYPTGTLTEICGALSGNNPKHEPIVEAYETNPAGEFIDPWGNAYQIETGKAVRIYSFGPNKIDDKGLGDDIVARPDAAFASN